jgi:FAD dependent oxidoreductase
MGTISPSYAELERHFEASVPSGPASLPVSSPTKAFWTHPGLSKDWPTIKDDPEGYKTTNPYAREGSEGTLTVKADVVIIGTGISGVSIALELARLARKGERRTMKVVILEARDFCAPCDRLLGAAY